jgi:acetyl esterase/lipase
VPPGPLPDATVRYADHDDAVIDLHLPRERTRGTLVVLHGGFWKQEWDRRHTREEARALADEGWLVATPEYRRVGGGGGWPTTGQDVLTAVRRLPELLDGLDLEVGELSAVGHSAGGHLVLWLSTRHPLRRAVALAPVCDLREAIRLRLGDDATIRFLGDHDPEEADPMTLLAERPGADVVLVHGVDDENVPVSLSRNLVAAHPWVRLVEVPGGHFEPIEPGSPVWPEVVRAIDA